MFNKFIPVVSAAVLCVGGVVMISRKIAAFSTAVGFAFAASIIVFPVSAQAEPRVDKRLCGVVEQGFTPLADYQGSGPGVTVGVAVRNRTNQDAVQVQLRVNAYDRSGRLLNTQRFGLQNVPRKQTVVDGYTWNTPNDVGSIKILLTCAKPSGFGIKRIPKYQRSTGTLDPRDSDEKQTVTGVFRNRQKTAYFYNMFFVVRNANGQIVGGSFSNTLGTVPRGAEIAWEGWIALPASMGPLRVQGNTSSVYSAF